LIGKFISGYLYYFLSMRRKILNKVCQIDDLIIYGCVGEERVFTSLLIDSLSLIEFDNVLGFESENGKCAIFKNLDFVRFMN
jgi:hypothetical protein